jgi:molybdopterin converting factor small subunit
MKVKTTYYGMIADKLERANEEIEFSTSDFPINLREHFERKYPQLSELSYSIAVDAEFCESIKENQEVHDISLLPPFAGG